MFKRPWALFVVIVYSVALIILPRGIARANIYSCSANLTPSFVYADDQPTITINLTNNDSSNDVQYINVNSFAPEVTIDSASAAGWDFSVSEESITSISGNLGPGDMVSLSLDIQTADNWTGTGEWTVFAGDIADGAGNVQCSGNTNMQVGQEAVDIYNIASSNSQTSATITWLTDVPASSKIEYGTTSSYGNSTDLDQTLVTSHSQTINNLSAGTSYHYRVLSTSASNTTAASSDNTFLTPLAVESNTTQIPVTSAANSLIKVTPTENIPPTIVLTTALQAVYKNIPTITGTAADNESIAVIQYSLDGGKNWLPAEYVTGLGTKKASFSFTPQNLQDGNYQLSVRAVDTSSNQASTPIQILVIDRLPPTVGGNVIAVGSQILAPNNDNVINSLIGVDQKITLSAVGGPTSVTIITTYPGKDKALQSFSLTKSPENGLWSGALSYSKAGTFQLVANSIDGAGNKTSRLLNVIRVNRAGKITDAKGGVLKAKVAVYTKEVVTNSWVLWDGEAYGQQNPSQVTTKGEYGLYLPEGTYYLKIEAAGYRTIVTRSFELANAGTVSESFKLNRKPGFDLGPIHLRLPWPVLSGSTLDKSQSNYVKPKSLVIDTALPQFNLPQTTGRNISTAELYGKPTILTFVSTWSVSAGGQLETLAGIIEPFLNVLAVAPGESVARLSSYAKLAAYAHPIMIDSDNQLFDKLHGSTIPVTYFIDRHGVVKKVMVGVLSKEDLLKNVSL